MPFTHSTFVTSFKVSEVKDKHYILSFINSFSANRFVLHISKDLFDMAFENREIDEPVPPFIPEEPEIIQAPESMSS